MKKVKAYFKSKKGLSLAELVCAVCIMAIAVAAASSGLAVSYQAIMAGTLREQAAADAQKACDVIMTCVECIPSNEPASTTGLDDQDEQDAKNLLFENDYASNDYTLTDAAITSICNGLDIDQTVLHQYQSESDCKNRDWKDGNISFVIENDGGFSCTVDGELVEYVNYKITTYIDYGKNRTATCVGSVSKPALYSE
jgi:type II secretory pathway pseudopilin PulG